MAEAVSIKSAAAQRRALRHCVIPVNSRRSEAEYDMTVNIAVHIIIIITNFRWRYGVDHRQTANKVHCVTMAVHKPFQKYDSSQYWVSRSS